MAPQIAAVPVDSLLPVNLDVTAAVATVLGSLPEIRSIRAQMATDLPNLAFGDVDRLEDSTLAMSHADAQYRIACAPPDDLVALGAEGTKLRELLRREVEPLVLRKRINGEALRGLTGVHGYKNVAQDLHLLVGVLRENWAAIGGKCGVELAELDRAEVVSVALLRSVGLREQGPEAYSEIATTRRQAFTLFMRAYDEVRRAVTFLRWKEGDADTIAPSLYAGRGGRGKSEVPAPTPSADAAAATGAAASNPGPASPASPRANAPVASPAASTPNQSASDPFLQ